MTKISCPTCATDYHPARLGLTPYLAEVTDPVLLTVVCPVCHTAFDGTVTTETVVTEREVVDRAGWFGWFRRTHMEQDSTDTLVITTAVRG